MLSIGANVSVCIFHSFVSHLDLFINLRHKIGQIECHFELYSQFHFYDWIPRLCLNQPTNSCHWLITQTQQCYKQLKVSGLCFFKVSFACCLWTSPWNRTHFNMKMKWHTAALNCFSDFMETCTWMCGRTTAHKESQILFSTNCHGNSPRCLHNILGHR